MNGEWMRGPDIQIPGVDGACKTYQKRLEDGHLNVLVGHEPRNDGPEVWHISVSHRSNSGLVNLRGGPFPGRLPTWDEIKEVRYKFAPDEINMAIMLPPQKHYINVHPTTIHLWEVPLELAELA